MKINWRQDFYGWKTVQKEDSFNNEEFVALNSNFQLTKYDPRTIEDNPPMVASNLEGLFPGFKIYQFPQTSRYRPFPLRVVYSKELGKVFELKGNNEPIYDLMRYLNYADLISEEWVNEKLYDYIIFFFDNVTGKHGRFEFIDLRSNRENPFKQVVNRVTNSFKLSDQTSSQLKKDRVEEKYNLGFIDKLKEGESIETIYEALAKGIDKFFANKTSTSLEPVSEQVNKQEVKIENLYTIFQNSLFKVDVHFSLNNEGFGNITLNNEKLCSLHFLRNEKDEIDAEIQFNEDKDDEHIVKTNKNQKGPEIFVTEEFPMFVEVTEKKKSSIYKFRLGQILSAMDEAKQPLDPFFSKAVHNNSTNIELSYAETIFLIEGSQTGIADCTLPPYVLYEAGISGDIKDATIRSELLEWYLDSTISKTGFLKLEGATIMSSLEYNATKISIFKNAGDKDRDERYSLDLSSKNIQIDFQCLNCKFHKGISFRDSYTENLLFEKVEIGKSYDSNTNTSISFNATNATIKGDVKITTKLEKASFRHNSKNEPEVFFSVKGKILLDNAKIDSSLFISNEQSRVEVEDRSTSYGRICDIQGMYLHTKVVKIEDCFIEGNITFDYSNFEQEFAFKNSILYGKQTNGFDASTLSCTYINTKMFDFRNSYFYGCVELYGSQMHLLACDGAEFWGMNALDASGIKSKSVFFRKGFFAPRGVKLHKSEIEGDLDCRESFIGFCLEQNFYGTSLTFRNSKARNVYFSDGFISLGQLDISSSTIDNLYCRHGVFVDPYEHGYLPKDLSSKTYAIYANNCLIKQKLNFNLSKTNTESLIPQNLYEQKSIDVNHLRNIRALYRELVDVNLLDKNIIQQTFDLREKFANIEFKEQILKAHDSISDKYIQQAETYKKNVNHLKQNKIVLENEKIILQKNIKLIEETYQKEWDNFINQKKKLEEDKLKDYAEQLKNLEDKFALFEADNLREQIETEKRIQEHVNAIQIIEQEREELYVNIWEANIISNSEVYDLLFKEQILSISKTNIIYALYFSIFKSIKEIQLFLQSKKLDASMNKFSIVYGEAFFEEIKIDGEIDCAAAIFYRKSVDKTIGIKKYAWQKKEIKGCVNSLTLSHSNINGTLYLNCGDGKNQLPFLSQGEVDLQYSFFKQLSITPSLATATGTRWMLIGTTYDTIYTYHQDLQAQKVTLESCDWIYPYHTIDNFRQPYEQLSNALFKNGDDINARKIVVYKIPSRNFLEASIMTLIIRPFFWLGFPLQRALLGLVILIISGIFYFQYGANKSYIIPVDENKSYTCQYNKNVQKIGFEKTSYTFQKLIPFVDGEQEESFTASYEKETLDSVLFLIYYNAYTLLSSFWIAMSLLSIARMRRNSS